MLPPTANPVPVVARRLRRLRYNGRPWARAQPRSNYGACASATRGPSATCCRRSTWRSSAASSWCWWAPPAAASRPRSASSRASRTPPAAASTSPTATSRGVPPAERDIAMVFQSYALYPHLTVYENLAFALRLRRTPVAQIDAQVRSAARSLELEPLLQRKPAALSGGQRQRVAIGARGGAPAAGVPVRRAAVQPRRQAAWRHAPRDRAHPPRGRRHLGVRDPRSGRGHDPGRSNRRDVGWRGAADRGAKRHLRSARQPLRRWLLRHAEHELPRRPRGRRRGRGGR
jgi:hypothetical protein